MLTDSRLHPRVDTDFEVKVGIPGDASSGARIISMSVGGIAIQGGQELEHILSMDQADDKGVTGHLISFSMPGGELSEVCRLVHVRRLSQQRYEFGLKFINLNPQNVAVISSYVNRHVRG